MNQYRLTRRKPYPPGSAGHQDLSAREGYYHRANNEAEALDWMKSVFKGEDGFDVQLWS
jgi:hypothetical protein